MFIDITVVGVSSDILLCKSVKAFCKENRHVSGCSNKLPRDDDDASKVDELIYIYIC